MPRAVFQIARIERRGRPGGAASDARRESAPVSAPGRPSTAPAAARRRGACARRGAPYARAPSCEIGNVRGKSHFHATDLETTWLSWEDVPGCLGRTAHCVCHRSGLGQGSTHPCIDRFAVGAMLETILWLSAVAAPRLTPVPPSAVAPESGLWGAPQRRFAAFAASPLVHTRGAGEARGLVPLAPERWYSPLGVRWKEARSEPLSSTSDESEEEDPSK